ncbi:MAG: YbaB/EbfC family nucleoid-associated protein [Desulfomonilaceae bacterium]
MFGLKDLMQQAQGLQTKISEAQELLAEMTVTGTAGGDMVQVVATGLQEIISVRIEPQLLESPDPELLEDLIVAATNDALTKSRELMTQEMGKIAGGLRIPGLT